MKRAQLESWIGQALAGTLSDEDHARLQEMLREDDEALALYLDTVAVEALLEDEGGKVLSFPRVKRSRKPWMWSASAALLLLSLIAIPLLRSGMEGRTSSSQADVDGGAVQQWEVVADEQQRSFALVSGVTVELRGPARYRISGDNELVLHRGILSADVPPEATGFRVLTPNGDVIDHGTQIGVAVDDEQTELHVFEGKAEVLLPVGEVSTMVGVGEAVRVHHPDNAGYEPIALRAEDFARDSLPSHERITFDFEPGSPRWEASQQGQYSDRGDRPSSPLTAGIARFSLLEGFVSLPSAPDQIGAFHSGPHQFAPHQGQGRILPLPFHDRDTMAALRLTSPPFHLDRQGGSLSAFLTGGRGRAEAPPARLEDLPTDSSDQGFLGLALRRVSDGRYLCSVRRAPGNFYEWARVEISAAELAAATAQDGEEEVYVLDLIDTYRNPHWSWIGLDSVSVPGRLLSSP
ncbi:FecR domain-containing protein [Roseibacillus ishigakijimensis]|uniref:FecR domain-containing protein n=1 Tax=Roseibacillus ishigakijimensis TaxID=454146 RepID=A0A934VHD2_9BACT|nr:FecR domain-containing protein [Roseibacillus ishigakijimensis]MBK1833823.1 FecR domain-containing protein [Roseibacillus ishigakijimensis]